MWIRKVNQGGRAATATTAFDSGQIVVLAPRANNEWNCAPSTATGDVSKRWGIGYFDHTKKLYQQQNRVISSSLSDMSSMEDVAVGDVVAVLSGEVEGSTNQVADGTYSSDDPLTVDFVNAVLKKAESGERIYFRVVPVQKQVKVTSKNNFVEVRGNIPDGYEDMA